MVPDEAGAGRSISRGSMYYLPRPISDADLALMHRLDALHLEHPFARCRMLRDLLALDGVGVGRKRVLGLHGASQTVHNIQWHLQQGPFLVVR